MRCFYVIERIMLAIVLRILRVVRRLLQSEPRMFALLGAPICQPTLAWIGRMKAFQVYLKGRRECPAYQNFLADQHASSIKHSKELSILPATTKENYVKQYDIESRCYGGRIPSKGVVIDESSGSSGVPNSWIRGPEERSSVKAIMQLSYALMFDKQDFFILNCFALGPWATGMNVSMSLVDVAIMKSIGPDKTKLENALKQFGPKYRYLIAGYPPFVKNFVDTTTLDLRQYDLHLVLGGEGMSEGLRAYFGKWFKSVFSSYGASDLEINIGAETEFTIALRQTCWKDAALSKTLFGREDPPMIFQYNPLDYLIEQNADGELIFTIARLANVSPKIRYNLRDRGGVYRHAHLIKKLQNLGINLAGLTKRTVSFPILYVYGRNDLSVPFFGCKIFTSDLDHIIHEDPLLAKHLNSFQIQNEEDKQFNRQLHLHLEQSEGSTEPLEELHLHDVFYNGLMQVNQDFREITKMITPQHVRVTIHPYGTGPFANRDIRIKNRYVEPNSAL
jgi:phenylacetate-CoA ligase